MYFPCKVEFEILSSPPGRGAVALQSEAPCPGEGEGMPPAWVGWEEASYS